MSRAAYSWAAAAALVAVYLCVMPANGQRGGSKTGGSTGKMEIPVQKSGKVVTQDGSPLPEPAEVVAFCGTTVARPIAKTDSKGGFVVGSGRSGEADARLQTNSSGPGGVLAGNITLRGCSLEARIPGYQSSALRITDDAQFDLGTIVLSRRQGVEGTTVSATSLQAPKEAQKAFDKAKQAMAKNKYDEARPLLEKAVAAYPQYAAAWAELGKCYQMARDLPKSREAFEKAIQADAKFITPYLHLALVYNAEKNWKGTADTTAALIKLDPFDYPAAYALNATSNLRLNNDAVAEASAKKAADMGGSATFPEVEYILGVTTGSRGDKKAAIEHFNNYLKYAPPNSPASEAVRKQIAELEK